MNADEVDEMRARIAAAARRMFQDEGFSHVSMRRLAKKLNCSPMTLYAYYPAKIDILRHIWADVFDALFAQLDGLGGRFRNPRARLKALASGYVSYWLKNPEHYRVVFMAEGVGQKDVSVFLDATHVAARFDVLLSALAAAAGVAPDDPAIKPKADLLVSTLNGIAHSRITISAYPWTDARVLAELAVDGLLAAGAT